MDSEKIYKEFGKFVADLRAQHNLSQIDAAKALGIPQTTYANYELGQRKIPLSLIIKLTKLLDFDFNSFVNTKPETPAPNSILCEEIEKRYKDFEFSKSERDKIIDYMDYIASKRG